MFCLRALLIAVAIGAVGRPGEAQATRKRVTGRLPVVVALTDTTFQGGNAVLIRRAVATRADVIVLSRQAAEPERLSAAAMALSALMDSEGDVAPRPSSAHVPDDLRGPRSERAAAARVLERLRSTAPSWVDGVGMARVATIYLPNASERARIKARRRPAHP